MKQLTLARVLLQAALVLPADAQKQAEAVEQLGEVAAKVTWFSTRSP